MRTKSEVGKYGETLAEAFLKDHNYTIICKNYRHRRLEIDLITKKNNLLIFVEVKTRSRVLFGQPEDAVDNKKAAKIIEAADYYIHEEDWMGDVRFDVISVTLSGKTHIIQHFEDAFY